MFLKIKEVHGEELTLNTKTASDKELIEFLHKILPDFDRSKVYVSDIKKIITWYNLLSKYLPELFEAQSEEDTNVEEVKSEATKEEKTEA